MEWNAIQTIGVSAAVGAGVSLLVERLKTRLSGEYWEAQERWKVKRDIYLRLLNSLRELAAVMDARFDLEQEEMVNLSGEDAPAELPASWEAYETRRRAELDARWSSAWTLFAEGRGSLPLVLSETTLKALQKLERDLNKSEYVAEEGDALNSAYGNILASAKADLKLNV